MKKHFNFNPFHSGRIPAQQWFVMLLMSNISLFFNVESHAQFSIPLCTSGLQMNGVEPNGVVCNGCTWTWSGANLTFSCGNCPATNITAPSPGTYSATISWFGSGYPPGSLTYSLTFGAVDNDGDGFSSCPSDDCNDNNAAIHPNTIWYKDTDNDGYSNGETKQQCTQPSGYKLASQLTQTSGDCNDNNANTHPGATELCNGVDDNCDNGVPSNELDSDSDGYRICQGDCNDNNGNIRPNAAETCNNIDDNCNNSVDEGGVCCPSGSIIYVKANATGSNNGLSWANAFTSLQAALALAHSCSNFTQIWVAAGTYKPGNDRDASFFLKNNLAIYGGFAGSEMQLANRNLSSNTTILSGDIGVANNNTDNTYRIVHGNETNSSAVLDGFTLTSAYNTWTGVGGALFLFNASPTIRNCIVSENYVDLMGGGVFAKSSSSAFTNCVFTGNTTSATATAYSAGLQIEDGSNVTLTNCTFYNNITGTRGGAAIYNYISTVTLKNCIIWGNSPNGLGNQGGGFSVSYSIVQGGYSGTGNLNSDPLFVNAAGGNLRLQACSPAIDAGTNTGAPTTDLDGNARVDAISGGGTVDMGAYEYQSTLLDVDGDGIANLCDNCPIVANGNQTDTDGDGWGDACDNCTTVYQNWLIDGDSDGIGDACDNCPTVSNANQTNSDSDNKGDACDNCPTVSNENQTDGDGDGKGDVCDNCPTVSNANQYDGDNDGIGHACDNCPNNFNFSQDDFDGDGKGDVCDNCPVNANASQTDSDSDFIGDVCDNCPTRGNQDQLDEDSDGKGDACDNCPTISNANQADGDTDGKGDVCDNCAAISNNDQTNSDGDTKGDACDNCPAVSNENQADGDGDGRGDVCDNCPSNSNANQTDSDGDGKGNACDNCPSVANANQTNSDGDSFGDACDNCPLISNASQSNIDNDSQGDACDLDDDNDGVPDVSDNCYPIPNSNQANNDGDSEGDECDADDDNDNIPDFIDNCPFISNNSQTNTDNDSQGDACDTDDDNDGTSDTAETACGSNPLNAASTCEICDGLDNDLDTQIDEGLNCCPAGNILYVKANASGANNGTSWTDAYTDLQAALVKAGQCANITQIWVAAGTYKPTSGTDRNASFSMKNNLAIYGGFPNTGDPVFSNRNWAANVTTLSGDIGTVGNNSDNSYHIFFHFNNSLNSSAVLDGFTIAGGNANGAGNHSQAGGMFIQNNSPTIKNCIFSGNSASDKGGGAYISGNCTPSFNNCTFSVNTAYEGGGIYNYFTSPVISDCIFSGNSATLTGGAMYNSNSSFPITNCIFSNNTSTDIAGITNFNSSTAITNCVFSGNANLTSLGVGGAMGNFGTSAPVLTNCTFSGNSATFGSVMLNATPLVTLKNCIIWGNTGGSFHIPFGTTNISNSIVQGGCPQGATCTSVSTLDPLFVSATDLRLQQCSPGIDAGNNAANSTTTDLDGNPRKVNATGSLTIDMGAYEYQSSYNVCTTCLTSGNILYVNANASGSNNGKSWANAFTSLQSALALANQCTNITQIWVAAGTYKPGTARTDVFVMKNNLAIYGGFPNTGNPVFTDRNWTTNVTTLSGDIGTVGNNSDNSYHVVFNNNNGLNSSAVLDGFTISGGNANGSFPHFSGGGMYNESSSPTVGNCTFSGNSATYGGGIYNEYSSLTMSNCTFSGNSATEGGGMFNKSSPNMAVTNSAFSGNSAGNGGGMYNEYSPLTLSNCTFSSNSAINNGGGVHNSNSSPTVTNCSISGNSATNGGGMYNSNSSPTVTNCTFSGNTATLGGGGMHNSASSSPTVTNCAFSSNSASQGGGMHNYINSNPTVTNCTFYSNSAAQGGGMYTYFSNPSMTNCIFWYSEFFTPFSSNPTVTYSIVQQANGVYPGTGNLNADPLFVSATDLRLQACSPALDTGDDTANSTTTDLDGKPRKFHALTGGSQIDMGAYERQSATPAPSPVCKNVNAYVDGAGTATVTAASLDNGSTGCSPFTYKIGGQNSASFNCTHIGTPQSVTLTVTDKFNQTATCNSQVTVLDTIRPNALCQSIVKNLVANGTVSITPAEVNNLSNDNCTPVILVSVEPNLFTCFDVGQKTVTLTVVDYYNNTKACHANVTVQDNTNPEAHCHPNLIRHLDGSGQATLTAAEVDNGSVDNCGIQSLSINKASFNCDDVGSHTVTLTVTDVNSRVSTCSTSVKVVDNIAPTANCNTGIVLVLDANGQATLTTSQVDNGSFDNCGIASRSVSPGSFNCSHVGNQQVVLTVTDENNLVSTCSTSVPIQDNTYPIAVCQDITVNLDAVTGMASITGSQLDGGSSDNCGIASFSASPNSFNLSNLGQNNVTFTVTDVNGRTSGCPATVTVTNTNAPNAVCQPYTAVLGANGTVGITAANVDNGSSVLGGIASMSVSPNSFTCSNLGSNQVTLTVLGNNNVSATCSANVTVQDNTQPSVTCKNHTVVLGSNGQAGIVPANVFQSGSDNCGTVNLVSVVPNSFNCSNIGSGNTVTLTVNDGNGNTKTCTATVTVQDNTPPTVVCKNITVNLAANGTVGITAAQVFDNLLSNDNCGTVNPVNVSPNSFTCSTLGAQTVTLTANDGKGNTNTCTATVTVQDNAAPTPLCRDVVVQLDPVGNASVTAAQVNNGSFDNCALGTLTVSPNTFTLANVGINPVTLTVPDVNSNPATCTAQVTVENNQLPNAVCQNITRNLNAAGQISLTAADVNGGSTALGGIASMSVNPNVLTCSNLGNATVVLTVTGNNTKQASCSATVTVQDVTQPSVTCKNHTVNLDGNGQATVAPAAVFQSGSDNCGTVNLVSVLPNSFTCSNLGGNTVTLTVNDGNGNAKTCTATVTVQDNSLPTVVCKNHTITLGANGQAGIVPADVFDNGGDNCGTVSLVSVMPNSFNCNTLGNRQVTLTVTDGHGNFSLCTATVLVQDNTPPVALCKNVTVQLGTSGTAGITPAMVNDGTSDNCSFSLSLNQTSFNCSHVGENEVTLTAIDPSENSHSCTATVTVQDNVAPVALCKNATVFLDATGQGSTTAEAVNNNSTDACGIASLELNEVDFDCSELGANPVTLTVGDVNGNFSTCTAVVSVVDNLAPTLVCQNISIQLGANASANISPAQVFDAAASSDNCGTVDLVSVFPNQLDCGEIGDNTVTLTANDGHGNTSTCTATVTVEDFFTNISVEVVPENCGMSNGSIVVTTDAPGGQVAFSINGGASWQFSGTFNNLPAGTYLVEIQAYGGMGCTSETIPTEVESIGSPQTWYKDIDGDGYSDGITQQGCTSPGAGWSLENQLVATSGDCNDYDEDEFPGQIWYRDMDNDDWSDGQTLVQCDRPWGYKTESETATEGDCDDTRNYCYPGATEQCNNLDDDCDGEVDEGIGGLTYVGNVTFSTQAQVNAWSQCYTVIQGNLTIQNAGIDSLAKLVNLQKVTGNVTIKLTGLDSLTWLMNLDTVGGTLNINTNSQLDMLDGLNGLTRVGGDLKVFNNQQLTDCCAIYSLINSSTGVGGAKSIFNNETGCDSESEINAECVPGQNLVVPGGDCTDCGVAQMAVEEGLIVWPNPTSDEVNIELRSDLAAALVTIYDELGTVVWREEMARGQRSTVVGTEKLVFRSGLYFVTVQEKGQKMKQQRVVIARQ